MSWSLNWMFIILYISLGKLYFPWVLVMKDNDGLIQCRYDNLHIWDAVSITRYIHTSLGMLVGCFKAEISLYSCGKMSNTRMIFYVELVFNVELDLFPLCICPVLDGDSSTVRGQQSISHLTVYAEYKVSAASSEITCCAAQIQLITLCPHHSQGRRGSHCSLHQAGLQEPADCQCFTKLAPVSNVFQSRRGSANL